MFDTVASLIAQVREALSGLDVRRLPAEEAVDLVEVLSQGVRVLEAARTLAARRVEETEVWRQMGYVRPATWLAHIAQMPVHSAIDALTCARQLESLHATREAFAAGELSQTQAQLIAAAASAAPDEEEGLLRAATDLPVRALKERCARVEAAALSAQDEMERYRRIHERRRLRMWTDSGGVFRIDGAMTPVAGAQLKAVIEARAARLRSAAIRQGRRESREAHQADALEELCREQAGADARTGGRSGPTAMVQLRCDVTALERGHTVPGEICEIRGVGPIPVPIARGLTADALLRVLFTKADEVVAISTASRTIPAALRAALVERDETCVFPGCDERVGLQFDHDLPFALYRRTDAKILRRLCTWHHLLKSMGLIEIENIDGEWVERRLDPDTPIPAPKSKPPPGQVGEPAARYGAGGSRSTPQERARAPALPRAG